MRILKIGKRIGSKQVHAVVQVQGLIKMAVKDAGRWIVVLEAEFNIVSKRHFLNQLF